MLPEPLEVSCAILSRMNTMPIERYSLKFVVPKMRWSELYRIRVGAQQIG